MSEPINWREWLQPLAGDPAFPLMARAIGALVASEKTVAVWISGSRATGQADAYSDLDLRAYAPSWNAGDLSPWLQQIDSSERTLVRLSKLGPTSWNYECIFTGGIPIDLLVYSGEAPTVSFDSVIFKLGASLLRLPSLQVIKEGVMPVDEIRNLMDGVVIDDQKFAKLFARDEPLAAFFLLEAQRLALLRLAYIATRGVDCGPRAHHTLASLKLARRIIASEGNAAVIDALGTIATGGTIEESVANIRAAGAAIFRELRNKFPSLPPPGRDELVRPVRRRVP